MIDVSLEPKITIDANTRKINVPDELRNIGVVGDQKAETVIFTMARYFDDIDLSTHTCIIRVMNAKNEYSEFNAVNINTTNDDIEFGWLINNFVTRYPGVITFTVQFETIGADGVTYQWQTTPAELNVLKALDVDSIIYSEDTLDLYRKLAIEVENIQQSLESIMTVVDDMSDVKTYVAELGNRVKYLEDNVIYATKVV